MCHCDPTTGYLCAAHRMKATILSEDTPPPAPDTSTCEDHPNPEALSHLVTSDGRHVDVLPKPEVEHPDEIFLGGRTYRLYLGDMPPSVVAGDLERVIDEARRILPTVDGEQGITIRSSGPLVAYLDWERRGMITPSHRLYLMLRPFTQYPDRPKITAIAVLREATGLGLKEAKELVESERTSIFIGPYPGTIAVAIQRWMRERRKDVPLYLASAVPSNCRIIPPVA